MLLWAKEVFRGGNSVIFCNQVCALGHIVSNTPEKSGETQCIVLKKGEGEIVLSLIYYRGILCLCLRKPSHEMLWNMGKEAILITPGPGWDPSVDENDEKVPSRVAIKHDDNELADV